jgi:hypothetical protein
MTNEFRTDSLEHDDLALLELIDDRLAQAGRPADSLVRVAVGVLIAERRARHGEQERRAG